MKRFISRHVGLPVMLLCLCVSCQKSIKSDSLVVYSGYAIGTTYLVKIADPSAAKSRDKIKTDIEGLLRDIDRSMSTFEQTSRLYAFNQTVSIDPFIVSRDFFTVVKEAIRISRKTRGAFDITIGPLVNLWGFGPGDKADRIPSDKDIKFVKQLIGYQHIQLDEKLSALSKDARGIQLDLSAIAKGYAVDQVAELLASKGFLNFLVEIGGEIKTKGLKPDHSAWLVAVERPVINKREVYKVFRLNELSMATSGDYRNFYEINGRRFSHVLSPFTGKPVENDIASVTVVHSSCMTADALATALMVLGPIEGITTANKEGIAALFIARRNGKLVESTSKQFDEFIRVNEVKR